MMRSLEKLLYNYGEILNRKILQLEEEQDDLLKQQSGNFGKVCKKRPYISEPACVLRE